jgi:CelD/BcsL family acetyltransferase involved in cellulose biosynthesis
VLLANLTVTSETLDTIQAIQIDPSNKLDWNLVFTSPGWLKTWWDHFGSGAELYLRSVRQGDSVLGIAPLKIRSGDASIIGSVNVCDYQDFIWLPGFEKEFCSAIFEDLTQKGVGTLTLESLRPDSRIATHLIPLAREGGLSVDCNTNDVSADMALPPSFEEYLARLDGKQRHEVRRKLRNIQSLGEVRYRVISGRSEIPSAIDTFLQLFPEYRMDKAEFLTDAMQKYFRALAMNLADADIVRFGSLDLAGRALAMIMYFDYNNSVYLYNSAYDPAFKNMSVGIVSKVLSIQNSIEAGKTRFDFLKGSEQYKYYLGGKEIPLSKCTIKLR